MPRVDSAAMARPTKNTTQLSVRIPNEQLDTVDALLRDEATERAFPGLSHQGRIDVLRIAISIGLLEMTERVSRSRSELAVDVPKLSKQATKK